VASPEATRSATRSSRVEHLHERPEGEAARPAIDGESNAGVLTRSARRSWRARLRSRLHDRRRTGHAVSPMRRRGRVAAAPTSDAQEIAATTGAATSATTPRSRRCVPRHRRARTTEAIPTVRPVRALFRTRSRRILSRFARVTARRSGRTAAGARAQGGRLESRPTRSELQASEVISRPSRVGSMSLELETFPLPAPAWLWSLLLLIPLPGACCAARAAWVRGASAIRICFRTCCADPAPLALAVPAARIGWSAAALALAGPAWSACRTDLP